MGSVRYRPATAKGPTGWRGMATRLRRPAIVMSLLALGFAVWFGVRAIPESSSERTVEPGHDVFAEARALRYSELPAYGGIPWADALKEEQSRFTADHLIEHPITGLSMTDFNGQFTNVADGVRRTLPPPPCDCRTVKVWLVGGSTAFGLGQRDDFTVASQLVGLAADHRLRLEVTNLAVPGWVIAQERRGVTERLASGDDRPDLLVSLSGFNDAFAALVGTSVHGPDPERSWRLDEADVQEFFKQGAEPPSTITSDQLGEMVARRFRVEMGALIEQLASSGEVKTLFLIQPDALREESQFAGVAFTLSPAIVALRDYANGMLEGFTSELGESVVNLRPLFDEVNEPHFADLVHINERGARIVAEAILEQVMIAYPS